MNNAAVTKEELLAAAREIARCEGIAALNVRKVAAACGISVGCLYNYYASKAELVLGLIEVFWNGVCEDLEARAQGLGFLACVQAAYERLAAGLAGFAADFMNQLSALDAAARREGRACEAGYWARVKRLLLRALNADQSIPQSAFGAAFSREALVDLAFAAMMASLRGEGPQINQLTEALRRLLRA